MYQKDHLLAKDGYEAKIQFDDFIDIIAKKYMDILLAFNWRKEPGNTFFGQ